METQKRCHYTDRIPLFAQLVILMLLLIVILILSVFGSIHTNAQYQIQTQMQESNQKLIRIELTNLDEYIDSIMNFCIQPCYDRVFYSCIESKQPLSSLQIGSMKDSMKKHYYSMTNIENYKFFLLNQNKVLYRDSSSGQFLVRSLDDYSEQEFLTEYLASGQPYGIYATKNDETFLTFYHSIIQIDSRKPQAVICVTVDNQFIQTLLENHTDNHEFICILNSQNQLLYSSNHNYVATTEDLAPIVQSFDHLSSEVTIHNTDFCAQMESSQNYGLKLLSCVPVTYSDDVSSDLLKSSLIKAATLCFAASLMVFVLIRLTTSPLTTFSKRLDQVAAGDYQSKLELGGSSEITKLCTSFNSMLAHINELDKKNTIEDLRLRSRNIKILNLSINPHYFYNVIQDIFIESSNCNEPKLMRMSQCISNRLNYINNNNDFATIQDEILDMNDYVYLMEVHIDQSIHVKYQILESLYNYRIPKITLQILTSPLIQYSIWDEKQTLQLKISVTEHEGSLYLLFEAVNSTVSNDFIVQYRANLPKVQDDCSNINGNPLLNLYSRLSILYNNEFSLELVEENSSCTCIKLIVPTVSETFYDME